jgi:hypothetical protein
MIDYPLSKENALPQDLWGMIYDDWKPNPEVEGVTVGSVSGVFLSQNSTLFLHPLLYCAWR